MNKLIKKVLQHIEDKGYEAYLVGGYVRDLLLGKNSYDIDICTNATPKDLVALFPSSSTKNLGGIDFKIKEYHFEITTYRKEIKYENRKPVEFIYIDNLLEDLQRRDFTINSICMNSKGEIIDLLSGIKEITSLQVKMIGNAEAKIKEDPLRILRAIRIATILNFALDKDLEDAIKNNSSLVKTLSKTRVKEEFDKILLADNVQIGLEFLKNLGILEALKIQCEDVVSVKSLEGMYAQLETEYEFPFTKEEKKNIIKIKNVLKKGEITPFTLYQNGLYLTLISGDILNVSKKEIHKMDHDLPIHHIQDIEIKPEELIEEFQLTGKEIRDLLTEIEQAILNKEIKNKKVDIIQYVNRKRKR